MAVRFAQGLCLASITIAFLLSHAGSTSASNIIYDSQALQKRSPINDQNSTDSNSIDRNTQPIIQSMTRLRENLCRACIIASVYTEDEEYMEEVDWREDFLKPRHRKILGEILPSVGEIIREHGGGSVPRRTARFKCSDVLRKYIHEIIELELNREDPEHYGNIFNHIHTAGRYQELTDRPMQIAVMENFREYFESESGEIVYNCVEGLQWWGWDESL